MVVQQVLFQPLLVPQNVLRVVVVSKLQLQPVLHVLLVSFQHLMVIVKLVLPVQLLQVLDLVDVIFVLQVRKLLRIEQSVYHVLLVHSLKPEELVNHVNPVQQPLTLGHLVVNFVLLVMVIHQTRRYVRLVQPDLALILVKFVVHVVADKSVQVVAHVTTVLLVMVILIEYSILIFVHLVLTVPVLKLAENVLDAKKDTLQNQVDFANLATQVTNLMLNKVFVLSVLKEHSQQTENHVFLVYKEQYPQVLVQLIAKFVLLVLLLTVQEQLVSLVKQVLVL